MITIDLWLLIVLNSLSGLAVGLAITVAMLVADCRHMRSALDQIAMIPYEDDEDDDEDEDNIQYRGPAPVVHHRN